MASGSDAERIVRIGVDSGGTFTDICLYDVVRREVRVWKVSSTPHDPAVGIVEGVKESVRALNCSPVTVAYFGHGTTVATNALIVGGGAETGMITTAGFRDVIELRRQKRDSLYDLQTEKPAILASRNRRLEVRERILFDGRVLISLEDEDVRTAARRLRREGVRAIAICCLFSYLMPQHEARIRQIVEEEIPDAFVSVSHEVAPEFREYERFSTTVVNAYLGPIMGRYLSQLEPRLTTVGVTARVHLTQSNGGVISARAAQTFPARTVLSGPAAGVMGAAAIGRVSGFQDLITVDMGGTSTDVSLIEGGRPQRSNDAIVHGYPMKLPMLDVHTVGAGGGSIATVDKGGMLQVGPRSAGADPGPICYGHGNKDEPTVTDANVVLQVLNPTHLLSGRLAIDRAKAESAIARLADRLGLDVMSTAQGVISVVTANMTKAIRVISVERGYDPRDYLLFAFGGAGPIHAARLARALDMPRIVVPEHPGIMSALGLLLTDLRTSFSLTRLQPLVAERADELANGFLRLGKQADAWFEAEEIGATERVIARSVDLRYRGQGYELNVPCPAGHIDPPAIGELRAAFERQHRQMYGYVAEGEAVDLTTLRLEAVGLVPKAELPTYPDAVTVVADARLGSRPVWLPETGGFADCPLYDRHQLGPGHVVHGPAIVEQMDSTTLILPAQTATVDHHLNLVIAEK